MSFVEKFPSLTGCLSSSKMTCLYFASSWCPDCTPITPLLKKAYEEQSEGSFQVVYVSSDNSEEEMMRSFNDTHGSWNFIPYDSDDRNGLKKHFGACAGKEVKDLGMSTEERKYGIPTLIIMDSKSHEVISYEGVDFLVQGVFLNKLGVDMK